MAEAGVAAEVAALGARWSADNASACHLGCRVRATREYTYVDELAAPVNSHYVAFKVVDDDDFPQGDYEVTFGGRTEKITKRGFQYYGR